MKRVFVVVACADAPAVEGSTSSTDGDSDPSSSDTMWWEQETDCVPANDT